MCTPSFMRWVARCVSPRGFRLCRATGSHRLAGSRRTERDPMTTPREEALADLRQSIDALPPRTRLAMLSGLGHNTVITGAFSDGSGVCPMLAAHREGGRTRCMSFPEAWDRFTGVHGRAITRQ